MAAVHDVIVFMLAYNVKKHCKSRLCIASTYTLIDTRCEPKSCLQCNTDSHGHDLRAQLSVSVAARSTAAAADKDGLQQRSQAVQAFFHHNLGLSPADNTGAYLSYHIPATQEAALPDFLQHLEAAAAELGVTDLNIGLTSLEEVAIHHNKHLSTPADCDKKYILSSTSACCTV